MKIKSFLKRLKEKFFMNENDKSWKDWVDFKEREVSDLHNLIASDVRSEFKRRAIFVLLVPELSWLPFYWKNEDSSRFNCKAEFINSLDSDLISYMTELVIEFYKEIITKDRKKYYKAFYFYNNCILSLLSFLPDEKAEELFEYYQLNDPFSFWDMDNSSGYNPFYSLLYQESLDIKYKLLTDQKMRKIVQSELSGESKPRESFEGALICYSRLIVTMSFSDNVPYSLDLFASQIQFIIDSSGQEKHILIPGYALVNYFKIFKSDSYKKLRLNISRYVILNEKEEFKVYSKERLQVCETILSEFGESDEELKEKLKVAIKAGKKELEKRKDQKKIVNNKEAEILVAMR